MLNNILDQSVANEFAQASSDVFNADVGGSGATTPIPVTTSNVNQLFTAIHRKLDRLNMPMEGRFALIGPAILETVRLYIGGKDTSAADLIGENGKVMTRFGLDLYYSNNLGYSARWTPANDPTANDTVTIAGVTFTFVASPAAAGDIDIEGTVATTLDSLVAAINGTGVGDGTDYFELTPEQRFQLQQAGIVATDGTTYLGITGNGDVVVSASDAANDPWSLQTQHMLGGVKGATDLVVQKSPNVAFRTAEKRLGRYVYPWMLFGKKTFRDMKDALVDVNIDASLYT
jgi:hypothetical protein